MMVCHPRPISRAWLNSSRQPEPIEPAPEELCRAAASTGTRAHRRPKRCSVCRPRFQNVPASERGRYAMRSPDRGCPQPAPAPQDRRADRSRFGFNRLDRPDDRSRRRHTGRSRAPAAPVLRQSDATAPARRGRPRAGSDRNSRLLASSGQLITVTKCNKGSPCDGGPFLLKYSTFNCGC